MRQGDGACMRKIYRNNEEGTAMIEFIEMTRAEFDSMKRDIERGAFTDVLEKVIELEDHASSMRVAAALCEVEEFCRRLITNTMKARQA